MELSRRHVLAAGVAVVTLPMLDAALRTARSASANATLNPAAGGARGNNRNPPAEKPGWFATTLKLADVKENEFTGVAGHAILLTRTGKTVIALTSKCTHQGCNVPAKAGVKTLTCPCHQAQFNLDGTVAKGPARTALNLYAIRLSDAGVIEIDPGTKPAKATDKDGSLTVAEGPATAPANVPASAPAAAPATAPAAK